MILQSVQNLQLLGEDFLEITFRLSDSNLTEEDLVQCHELLNKSKLQTSAHASQASDSGPLTVYILDEHEAVKYSASTSDSGHPLVKLSEYIVEHGELVPQFA